jgi:hypothetical protein
LGGIRIAARPVLAAALVSLLCGCAEIGPSIPPGNDWTTPARPGNPAATAVPRHTAADGMPIRKVPAVRRALTTTFERRADGGAAHRYQHRQLAPDPQGL